MLDFYIDAGIDQVCSMSKTQRATIAPACSPSTTCGSGSRDFLGRFWRLGRQRGALRFIREIDAMVQRVVRPEEAKMRNQQVVPFGMINVAANGDVSSFSPELLGLKNECYADFIVGNVHRQSLAEMGAGEVMQRMTRDIAAGVERCRLSCDYFSVCGGGAPVNKLTENGLFASDRTRFCELTQMVPTDLILDALERMIRSFSSRIPRRHRLPGGRNAKNTPA